MLGLTSGELTLVAILVFAVVSAKFWPAVGAALAVRLGPRSESGARSAERPPKSERTQSSNST
jgi:hypothetical protein